MFEAGVTVQEVSSSTDAIVYENCKVSVKCESKVGSGRDEVDEEDRNVKSDVAVRRQTRVASSTT